MSLTTKKQGFYTAKTCSSEQSGGRCRTRRTLSGFSESVKVLPGRILCLLLIILVCLMPLSALALEKGDPAPGFTLEDIHGQKVSLGDFKGRTVLLKLGTTWCPTCKTLSADIDSLGDFLRERNVAVIEVFVQDSLGMIEKFVGKTQHPMTFHAVLDDGQVYRSYNVYLIPRLLVIDADQLVQFDNGGRDVTSEKIVKLVNALQPQQESGGASPAKK